ncbi:hypothetical protein M1512_03515 [Patescibacteria group bacterium]|nr:hypothetical protein [Patescibacteria group bacterium]
MLSQTQSITKRYSAQGSLEHYRPFARVQSPGAIWMTITNRALPRGSGLMYCIPVRMGSGWCAAA